MMRPLQHQTWETFSVNWHTDVKIAFTWLREALLKPLPPATRVVVVVSSGAAINGSPANGGYAGAKATQRSIAAYAQEESRRAGLDLTVTAARPTMTPSGDVGRRGVRGRLPCSLPLREARLGKRSAVSQMSRERLRCVENDLSQMSRDLTRRAFRF